MISSIDPRTVLSYSIQPPTPEQQKTRDLESLRETTKEFEALLLMEAYKAMRKTVPEGGLIPKTMAIETFQEMLDMEIARETANSKGMGIADAMYNQLAPLIENKRYE